MYKPVPYFDNPTMVPIKYQFVSPIKVKVKRINGLTHGMSYGIGDMIEIMEPDIQSLVCRYEHYKEITLKCGTNILNVPEEIKLERVYNGS